jgi:hypothetical protein
VPGYTGAIQLWTGLLVFFAVLITSIAVVNDAVTCHPRRWEPPMSQFLSWIALLLAFVGVVLTTIAAVRGRPLRPQLADRHHELWLQMGKGFWALDQFYVKLEALVNEGGLLDQGRSQFSSEVSAMLTNARENVSSVKVALQDPKLVDLSHAEQTAGTANMLTALGALCAATGLLLQVATRLL